MCGRASGLGTRTKAQMHCGDRGGTWKYSGERGISDSGVGSPVSTFFPRILGAERDLSQAGNTCPKWTPLACLVPSWEYLSQAGNTCPKLGILVLSGLFLLLGHKRSGLLAPRQMDCDVRPTVEHCCEKLQISRLVSNSCRQIFLHPANCDVQ